MIWGVPRGRPEAERLLVSIAVICEELERTEKHVSLVPDVDLTFWQCPMSRAALVELLQELRLWLDHSEMPNTVDIGVDFPVRVSLGGTVYVGPGKTTLQVEFGHTRVNVVVRLIVDYSCILQMVSHLETALGRGPSAN